MRDSELLVRFRLRDSSEIMGHQREVVTEWLSHFSEIVSAHMLRRQRRRELDHHLPRRLRKDTAVWAVRKLMRDLYAPPSTCHPITSEPA